MALVYIDRAKVTTTTTGTGTLTLGSAVSGYQTFAGVGDGNTCVYVIEDVNGTAWEVGIGTYTASGTTLARTTVLASTNSNNAINISGSGSTVYVAMDASRAIGAFHTDAGIIPGGRLTLTSGTPITTSDVTGATSIYYTPYVHDRITLWTGAYWAPIQFTEYTLALGTLTSGKPYDVFAYLNSGALALEVLVWTSDSARATAVTLQDGRYCKSGDKTRLLLGTFYTTATTTTEDSALKRYVANVYNTVPRGLTTSNISGASHTYNVGTWREWNAGTNATRLQWVISVNPQAMPFNFAADISPSGGATGYASIGVDSTSADPAESAGTNVSGLRLAAAKLAAPPGIIGAGKHYACAMEYADSGTATFSVYWLSALVQA